ncbi:MAG: class I SAM-dependent methyltransferase [Candidatus Thorarchaeota archaeon]
MDDASRFEVPQQEITLEQIPGTGRIIDIGGGGEGLVSRIEGQRVCALDRRISEVREARIHDPPVNWIVGDGQMLSFRNSAFQVATSWFSLGYMPSWEVKKRVMQEVHRVLEKDGVYSIIACTIDCEEEVYIFRVLYTLPDGTISQTGYGVRGGQGQTPSTVSKLLGEVGFTGIEISDNGYWFQITARKT